MMEKPSLDFQVRVVWMGPSGGSETFDEMYVAAMPSTNYVHALLSNPRCMAVRIYNLRTGEEFSWPPSQK